ncbi:MAG: hypothetical protein RLZZ210_865, partial [Pseudomonadota bacterium]
MAVNNSTFNPADAYLGSKNIGEQEANWNSVTYDESGHASANYAGGGSNKVPVTNESNEAIEVVITGNDMQPQVYTIPPRATLEFNVPENFSGRIQKKTGNSSDPANLLEFTFEGDKLWFNQSDVEGRNSNILASSGDMKLGSLKTPKIPEEFLSVDQYGHKYLKSPKDNPEIEEWLRNNLREEDGSLTSYILYNDDIAMRDTGMTGFGTTNPHAL